MKKKKKKIETIFFFSDFEIRMEDGVAPHFMPGSAEENL